MREGRLRSRNLRVLQHGSAPIHPDTLRALIEALPGVDLVQMFGQTEGSPITVLTAEDHRRAAPGVELRIDAPHPDGVGEVVARARHLFTVDAEGWLHSGDLGRIDGDGYLHLAGRRGDCIIRGGENIYPVEVEEVLARHPAVREVAVVGVPDRYWGEVVKAVRVVDLERRPTEDELRAFCRRALGKVLRRLLNGPAGS